MSSNTENPKKPKIFYGYWIVLVAFLSLFIMSGTGWYAFSLFVKPLQEDMGWSRGEIMLGFTILFLIIGVISPFIGRVVDRYGARRIIAIGAAIAGLGFVSLTRTNSLLHFYLSYAVVGIGLSSMGTVPASAVVSKWFRKKRGLAIGIMSVGLGIAGFFIAPFIGSFLIPDFGWRAAYLALALLIWVIIIPLALLLIKERPEDIGLYPDGAEAPEAAGTTASSPSASDGLTRKMAMATPAFWVIAVSFFLNNFGHNGTIQSQVPHLQDIGFPLATAATALGAIGLSSAAGKFIFGWLCDRIEPKYAAAISIGLELAGVIILINIGPESSVSTIWLYALTMGLGMGGWLPTMSMLTSSTFGLVSYGAIFGVVSLLQNVGAATGPLVAGYLYDIKNDYHLAFIICLVAFAIAIPAVLSLRRPSSRS